MSDTRGATFVALIFAGGLIFGFGLGFSHMAQPEIVLSFLQLQDLGLLFVMGGAAGLTMATIFGAVHLLSNRRAPLTGSTYRRRLKSMDSNVVIGGTIFGVGWGLSGICPGAAYASLGVGNYVMIWGLVGMFAGAYLQGAWRSRASVETPTGAEYADS